MDYGTVECPIRGTSGNAAAGIVSLDYRYANSTGQRKFLPEGVWKLTKHRKDNKDCTSQGDAFKPYLDRFGEKVIVIYSMWSGYLRGAAADPGLADLLLPYRVVELHTSGHATAEALKEVYDTVKPKMGLIPFHSEKPEGFASIIGKANVILLSDGEVFDA